MTALLVNNPTGGFIGFGSRPGFGLSFGYFINPNTFSTYGVGSTDRYVLWGTGMGDHQNESFTTSDFDDAGLFPGSYVFDGSARGAGAFLGENRRSFGPNLPFVNDRLFFLGLRSNFGGLTTRIADDGIDCYDAAPSAAGGAPYSALFMGNRCQTWVDSFQLGGAVNVPQYQSSQSGFAQVSGVLSASIIFATMDVGKIGFIVVAEQNTTTCHTPNLGNGWTMVPAPPDGLGYALTVYYKIIEEIDTHSVSPFVGVNDLHFTAPVTGFVGRVVYNFTGPAASVDQFQVSVTDGTNCIAPSVTTTRSNSNAVAFVCKTTSSGNLIPPAGWTSRSAVRGTIPGNTVALTVADKTLVSPGASGAASFTNAANSFGAAITVSVPRGPGLELFTGPAPGTVDYTGLPFEPDLAVFTMCDPLAWQATDPNYPQTGAGGWDGGSWMYGAADKSGNQWVTAVKTAFGSGPTFTGGCYNQFLRYRRFRTDACAMHIGSGSCLTGNSTPSDVTIALVAMNPDGATFNVLDYPSPTMISAMFIKAMPGRGAYAVGNSTPPGSTGTQIVTGLGFQPEAVLVASAQTTSQALSGTAGDAIVGVSDGVTQRGGWAEGITGPLGGPPGSPPREYLADDAILLFADSTSDTILAKGSLQSLDADGFTLDWTTNDGAARLFGWIALANDSESATLPVVTTDPVELLFVSGATARVNFHGRIIPNSISGDPVNYYFQYGQTPAFFGSAATTARTDGSGTSETTVSENFWNIGSSVWYSGFCYRLVAVTQEGCVTYGDTLCVDGMPVLTFGNKFRIEQ